MVEDTAHSCGSRRFNPLRKLLVGRSRRKASSRDYNNNNNNSNTENVDFKHQHRPQESRDARVTLFSCTESEVSQYKVESDESDLHAILQKHKPSVISQGKFQIYTINTIFNYFTSGSLTHPILSSSQFIKININTYIIPIRNRRRYWKLSLNTENTTIIEDFEKVLTSIAKLKIDMISNFSLQSPFNSFINTSNSSNTLNITDTNHSICSNSLILHHPIPVRPQTSSTVSIDSLVNINDDISSLNTTYSDIDKFDDDDDNYDDDIAYSLHDISSSDLLTIENIQNPDIDLDDDLLNSEDYSDLEFKDTEINQLNHSFDELLQHWERNISHLDNIVISKRYSLSFKDYDDLNPISADVMNKYKNTLKHLVIESNSNTGLFDKYNL